MRSNLLPKTIPPSLPGSVIEQKVKCGKPGCKCASGELHSGFYRFYREEGRLKKKYVRRSDLAATRAACEVWRRAEELMRTWDIKRKARILVKQTEEKYKKQAYGPELYTLLKKAGKTPHEGSNTP